MPQQETNSEVEGPSPSITHWRTTRIGISPSMALSQILRSVTAQTPMQLLCCCKSSGMTNSVPIAWLWLDNQHAHGILFIFRKLHTLEIISYLKKKPHKYRCSLILQGNITYKSFLVLFSMSLPSGIS